MRIEVNVITGEIINHEDDVVTLVDTPAEQVSETSVEDSVQPIVEDNA